MNAINRTDAKKLYKALLKQAKRRTAIADARLDEDGKTIKGDEVESLKHDEGVVMVESRAAHLTSVPESDQPADDNSKPVKKRKKPRNDSNGELF